MAMVIAWHILNKVTYPQDSRFSKNVLAIAPGLTVKSRLAVLEPAAEGNYYEAFRIVPPDMMDKLRQGNVLVHNWHTLAWESEEQIKSAAAWTSAASRATKPTHVKSWAKWPMPTTCWSSTTRRTTPGA